MEFIRHVDVDWLFEDYDGDESLREIVFLSGFTGVDSGTQSEIVERMVDELDFEWVKIFDLCEEFSRTWYWKWSISKELVEGLVDKHASEILSILETFSDRLKFPVVLALSKVKEQDIQKGVVPYLIPKLFSKREEGKWYLDADVLTAFYNMRPDLYDKEVEELLKKMDKEQREWCGNLLLHSPLPEKEKFAEICDIPTGLKDEPIIKNPETPAEVLMEKRDGCLHLKKGDLVDVVEGSPSDYFVHAFRCWDYSHWFLDNQFDIKYVKRRV